MSILRIYVVDDGDKRRLIEASSAAQAIRHCAKHQYTVKIATPKEVASLMQHAVQVEHAGDDSLIPTKPTNGTAQHLAAP
jgi:hypothetical protein